MADIKKRVFSSKLYKDSQNIAFRSTSVMVNAIDEVARNHGMERSQLIVEVLEQFLQEALERGEVSPPPQPE